MLEWQILKNFLVQSPGYSVFNTIQLSNPAASGFKGGKLLPIDLNDLNSTGMGESTWRYCSYLWFWWSKGPGIPTMTYDGLTLPPIDLVNYAIPNKDNFQSEL